ncbi:hypothetical protein [Micromonospora sp. 4G55]|uniref:hypothetical protein n=1 Tax=Micromonospora sp. 4G55 TaxID=2806102 RepID=UPI001A5E3082|nr:hypothetical protein [Micromonospora sp. 4G55]MBM0255724.1 hypothetical protein [Micromonospora sp. 4G55]
MAMVEPPGRPLTPMLRPPVPYARPVTVELVPSWTPDCLTGLPYASPTSTVRTVYGAVGAASATPGSTVSAQAPATSAPRRVRIFRMDTP